MGQDNSNSKVDEIDNGKICQQPDIHAFEKIFKCDKMNCEQILCNKCIGSKLANGTRLCILCTLNNHNTASTDISLGVSDELNKENGKAIGSWEQTVSVKRDPSTNTVIGWDSLYSVIDQENKLQADKLEKVKKLQKDFVERNKNF